MKSSRAQLRLALGLSAGLVLALAPSFAVQSASRRASASSGPPAGSASTDSTNGTSGLEFSSFRIISERNIFDPNRSGRRAERAPRETRRAPRVDSFSLVGTMSYAKGAFAFFDGSGSDYRKSLAPGATIAGYLIREITPTSVKLEANGSTLELKVGGQLRREEEGEWKLDSSGVRASYDGSSSSSSSGGGSGSSSSSGGSGSGGGASESEVNEVLKRLMEQREKELK